MILNTFLRTLSVPLTATGILWRICRAEFHLFDLLKNEHLRLGYFWASVFRGYEVSSYYMILFFLLFDYLYSNSLHMIGPMFFFVVVVFRLMVRLYFSFFLASCFIPSDNIRLELRLMINLSDMKTFLQRADIKNTALIVRVNGWTQTLITPQPLRSQSCFSPG